MSIDWELVRAIRTLSFELHFEISVNLVVKVVGS